MDSTSHDARHPSVARPAKRTRPFQFSVAALFVVVTAYSILFGFLSWMQLGSPAVFAAVALYLTTLAVGQVLLFGGRRPYRASALLGFVLGVAGILAVLIGRRDWLPFLQNAPECLAIFALVLCSAGLGVGVGGLVDIALLLLEIVLGVRRKVITVVHELALDRESFARQFGQPTPDSALRMALRYAILVVLVFLFAVAVFMTRFENGTP